MTTRLIAALAVLLAAGGIFAVTQFDTSNAQDTPTRKDMPDIQTSDVTYLDGETGCEGYRAWDASIEGKRPVILIVHDWMGRGDYDKRRAREVAELGYMGFSIDVYGTEVRPANREEAQKASSAWYGKTEELHARLKAGMKAALSHDLADKSQVAIMGYCFGGMCALELARSGADIDGAISFHGSLASQDAEAAKNIKAKVLVLHGADDPFADLDQVQGFVKEMQATDVDYEVVLYGNAVHSFTNPAAGNDNSKGAAYNAKADRRSWEAMKDFYAEIFG